MRTTTRLALGLSTAALALGVAAGPAGADPTNAEPQGCHGSATVGYKQGTGDPGATGDAIGGGGNSDGDPSDGQAHNSDASRGEQVQGFLVGACGQGSQT